MIPRRDKSHTPRLGAHSGPATVYVVMPDAGLWRPPTPRAGWTLDTAAAAALDYAAEHEPDKIEPSARAAHRRLLGALPELRRADLIARLEGIDHLGDLLDAPLALGEDT